MTIKDAFELYRTNYILFKNLSQKTDETYQATQKRLLEYFGDFDIEDLTLQDVRNWKFHLDKGRCASTVRGYVICLRVVLKYHRLSGLDVIDPEIIPVPKRIVKVPTFITAKEVDDLICEAGKAIRGYTRLNRTRNQAIISLLYSSGLRVSEACSLDRGSIKDNSFTVVGKGGKARLCFIDERTKNLLEVYLESRTDSHPALFISNQNGKRITAGNVQRVFSIVSYRMGMKVHPHVLRHSFATNLLTNNCNMRYVQVMLGHSSLQTTQMYTHVVDKDLQKIYSEFHTTR